MTSNGKRASSKSSSKKPQETAAEKKVRQAEERRARLAAQAPRFSLSGFREGASPNPAGDDEENAPSGPQTEDKERLGAQKAEPVNAISSIFAGFTGEDGATTDPVEEAPSDPVVPPQQVGHTVAKPEGEGTVNHFAVPTRLSPDAMGGTEVPAEVVPGNSPTRLLGQDGLSGRGHSDTAGSQGGGQRHVQSHVVGQATSSPPPARSNEVAHRTASGRGGYSISSVAKQNDQAPRRERRQRVERFDPSQRQASREEALRELQSSAPRYSALLIAYRVGQLSTVTHKSRNVHLYGAAFEQLADQGTSDKALLLQLTGQRHKLTPAHYVDAVLEAALEPLDPMCVEEELIEDEKDYVEKLADVAFAYRSYILNNRHLAEMGKQRFTCPLRPDVDAKVSRMMDLLNSMPTIKIQPYEIISAVVADYLNGLPDERPHVESFFAKSTETTYH